MSMRTICLEKQGHTFLFRYELGFEDQLVEQLMLLADDRESLFDWNDAATLSFQATSLAAEEYRQSMFPGELAAE
jgi:hypothetical protein